MSHCPHCGTDTDIAEQGFANGVLTDMIRHCPLCNCRYRVNRRYEITEILVKGATPNEIRTAVNEFAAAYYQAEFSRYYHF